MDRYDGLKVALVILFAMFLFQQLTDPKKYDMRDDFKRSIYSMGDQDRQLMMDVLQYSQVHNQGKNCKDVFMPVCNEVVHNPSAMAPTVKFCISMLEYCKRYEPNYQNIAEY